jgi:hypothetical protein
LVEINEPGYGNRISNRGVVINSDNKGSFLQLYNITREQIITLQADDYGNGEVGVWNRKGKGRVYDSQ